MSTPAPGVATLRALVARATLAPSTHNAQPWRWTVHPDHVDLELDDDVARRLGVTDPDHRELVISCGAALLTLRVAAAQALFDAWVEVAPDPHRHDLLACVTIVPGTVDAAFATLDDVVPLRRTAWSAFDERRSMPAGLGPRLASEAHVEGACLNEIEPGHRDDLADLLRHADHDRYLDPRRRAELAGWITSRWADEGRPVAAAAVGPARAAVRHLDLGDRIAAHDGELLRQAPYIAVLSTPGDDRKAWIAAGQALQRVLLVAAEHGVSGGFLNAPCQIEADRGRLRALLPGGGYPQMVLRLGYPISRPPGTARRPVDEVVTVHDGPGGPDRGYETVSPREVGADFTEDALG
jgi:nitroreductase